MSSILLVLFLLFASVVYIVYLILPKKARPYSLLAFSIIFYAIYSKFLTVYLLFTIATVYLGGYYINRLNDIFAAQKEGFEKEERKKLKAKFALRKRWIVAIVIILNVGMLAMLKYCNFFSSIFEGFLLWFNVSAHLPLMKIVLPLGISYYTLSAIGYLIDVGRGKYRAGSFWQVALFISFFPQLYEGPFANFDKLSPQLWAGDGFNKENYFSGLISIFWGFTKKIVIADRLYIIADEVFKNYANYNGIVIVLGIVLFTFALYAEFSGLIDVAKGTSQMFNIKLAKNFEQPFFSQNVNEFWRKWHMSLGAWLKDYIFYPVSMSKGMMKLNKKLQGKVSTFWQVFIPSAIALFCVWITNGIWHGAGLKYIVYGMYYYVIMMIGMLLEPLTNLFYTKTKINRDHIALKILRIFKTFILVNIGMLIFRADNLTSAVQMFGGIFTGGSLNLSGVIDLYDGIMCGIGVVALIVADLLQEAKIDLRAKFVSSHMAIKAVVITAFLVVIIVFGAYGNGYIPPDPIYGAF